MDPVILSYHDVVLRRSDVKLLTAPCWLNDSVIGFAFEYLQKEEFSTCVDSAAFISPEVTQFIKCSYTEDLGSFLEPLELPRKKAIFLAVNDHDELQTSGGSHWSLLLYNRAENTFHHFDSLGKNNLSQARRLAHQLERFLGLGSKTPALIHEESAPSQSNAYDCGVYVICNVLLLGRWLLLGESFPQLSQIVTPAFVTQQRLEWRQLVERLAHGGK
uniref:SUMO peptidase family member, NEDD8 specific n=1 Tax=Eptatretus burgeri TaxID=7764 RepID=A0A8C4QP59_EPTBU